MATMTVSVPDPMRDWMESRVESGHYASINDYLRDLIRRDQVDIDEREAIAAALIAGEQSGLSSRQVPDILRALKTGRGSAVG